MPDRPSGTRELVVLGTASQVPTRTRNHNGYALRWDGEVWLFDPGEGTQRQLLLAGVPASSITRICITHAHGDHCLGLPGVLARMNLDGATHPVHLYFPAEMQPYVARLRTASALHDRLDVREHPVEGDGVVAEAAGAAPRLEAARLEHRVPTLGWRLVEPDGRRFLPERLAEAGVRGPDVGRLSREGSVEVDGRRVRLEDVTAARPGQRFAFVMDTRECTGAERLAQDADLLVAESTFLDRDAALAAAYAHLTAAQAGRLARAAGVRRLVLTHFSQRYGEDVTPFEDEARAVLSRGTGVPVAGGAGGGVPSADVRAARDLDRVPLPPRLPPGRAVFAPAEPGYGRRRTDDDGQPTTTEAEDDR